MIRNGSDVTVDCYDRTRYEAKALVVVMVENKI
jgi:hypothetical protein